MLPIKGLQKLSLIDYPKKLSAIMFLAYCNFRCSYCYNSSLVLNPESGITFTEQDVLDFLETRKGKLDALVISGGEPTLHPEIVNFIKKVKKLNFLVKLDTNGTNPSILKELIKEVDYIAMDIKAPLEKYSQITNTPVNIEKIKESIDLIKNSKVDYEFRTTVLPKFLSEKDILKIAQLLKGSRKFSLQQFQPMEGLINPNLKEEEKYSEEQLQKILKKIKPYFEEVERR